MTNPAKTLTPEAQAVLIDAAVTNAHIEHARGHERKYNLFHAEPGGHYRHPSGPPEGVWTTANVWVRNVGPDVIQELLEHDLLTVTSRSVDGRVMLKLEATIAGAEVRAALIY